MMKFKILILLIIFAAIPATASVRTNDRTTANTKCAAPLNAGSKIRPDFSINVCWFENFSDSKLTEYILEALENNKDIKIARQNILKYRQEKNLNISKEFPEINVGADYLLLKIPKSAIPRNDIQTNSFALPFTAVWEIDYLGKNYNEIQKSRLDVENAMWELKSIGLIVAADTAEAYFNISNLNRQIELQNRMVSDYKTLFKSKTGMFENGVISILELNTAQDAYIAQLSRIENLKKQREIFLTQLAYLTGKSPYNLDEISVSPFETIEYKGVWPEFFTGDIIFNRPDIMKTENELKKAKLDITIAKKDFLPKINVFGVMAFSTVVQNFGWDGVFAALSTGAVQNLFDGGKRIFSLKKRKREYEAAIENYLKTDLNALKEVNDTLFTLKQDLKVHKNNETRAQLENSNFVKVFNSYKTGAKSLLDKTNENSQNLNFIMDLANSKNQNFINLLSLYKAVGGEL